VAELKPIEIFYDGRHIDYSGRVVPVSREELNRSVAHFNQSGQKLPLVMRHPVTNDDAFGYATRLAINKAGKVVAVAYEDVSKGAASIINSIGAKISAKIRLPGNPANTSNGIEFDHIGFFPKGEKVALDKLNVAQFKSAQVSYIKVSGMDEDELRAEQEKLAKAQADFAKKQAAFEAQSAQFAAQSAVAPVVNDLVAKGLITPKDQPGMVDVFTKLAMVPSDQFSAEFAAAKNGGNAAVEFLAQAIAKKAIPYGKDNSQAAKDSAEFAKTAAEPEPDGDEDPSMAMDKKIKAHMAKNKGMSYGAAMEACAGK
jgi:hypothetical protein